MKCKDAQMVIACSYYKGLEAAFSPAAPLTMFNSALSLCEEAKSWDALDSPELTFPIIKVA